MSQSRVLKVLLGVGLLAGFVRLHAEERLPQGNQPSSLSASALPLVIPYPHSLKFIGPENLVLGEGGRSTVQVLMPQAEGFYAEAGDLIERTLKQKGFDTRTGPVQTRIVLMSQAELAKTINGGVPEAFALTSAEEAVLNRSPQAYVIRMQPGDPARIDIIGAGEWGAYYGATTLAQLIRKEAGNRAIIPHLAIQDYPDLPYRMSGDWVLKYDWEVNGYDWGDGLEAFIARGKRKIDLCSRYKVNMIRFLGGRMLPETPGSADRFDQLKRFAPELNRYAARKGVALQYSMSLLGRHYYTWGNAYTEPWLESRESYPDGPPFTCIGKRVQNCASCPSNRAQRKIILEKITQFIRATEPRAIYLHHMDHFAESYAYIKEVWSQDRCAHCRQLFPDDEPMSPHGLAGAMAQYYQAVIHELKSVRNPASGYDAARDLMITFASPLYTLCSNDDADWDKSVKYWQTVAGQLQDKTNVSMTLREQYQRWDLRGLRTEQMARALAAAGWPGAVFMFAVQGGGFLPDHFMLVSSPVLTGIYRGAHVLYNFNGPVHSEVQVLANVNYAWNHHAPGSVDPLGFAGRALEPVVQGYAGGTRHSDYLYGPFLEAACERLYGSAAAPYLVQMFRLERDQGPLLPVLTAMEVMPPAAHDWAKQAARNRQAKRLVDQGLEVCDPAVREDLSWMSRCLEAGARMSDLYNLVYNQRQPAAEIKECAGALRSWLEQKFRFDTTEPDGGDVGQWQGLVTQAIIAATQTPSGKSP